LLSGTDDALTLGDYLDRNRYSRAFREHYIVPMGMSIWSASERAMLSFPARFFVEFFDQHGFLNVDRRPVWQVIKGGSREYMRRLIEERNDHLAAEAEAESEAEGHGRTLPA
jgi:predicted NAD/FAD-binding protein